MTGPRASARKAPARKAAEAAPAAGPVLLSGGNPQIPKGEGAAPVQAYIAAMPGWKRAAGEELDALILRVVPEATRAVKWNSPLYGMEGKGFFLGLHCFAKYIKVAFFHGAALDPPPPEGSKDPNTRYVHIREGEPLDQDLFARWLRQAADGPGWVP